MDQYEVLKVIGRGSYGSALLVRQRQPQGQQQDANPGTSSSSRLFVMKQISLAPLDNDDERSAGSAYQQHQQQHRSSSAASSASVGGSHQITPLLPPPATASSRSIMNEVEILMRVGNGHPNICRYRASFVTRVGGASVATSSSSTSASVAGAAMMSLTSSSVASALPSPTRGGQEVLCILMDWYAGSDLARRIKQRTKQIKLQMSVAKEISDGGSAAPFSSSFALPPTSTSPSDPPTHFTEDEILDYFVQLLLGLKYIHQRNILHRDLKTSNLMISLERKRSFHRTKSVVNGGNNSSSNSNNPASVVEVLKICDFGISRLLDTSSSLASTRIGTPYFLSPEIARGEAYDQKADMWSAGCILYQLLTGRHAFQAGNLTELVGEILRGTYSPIPKVYSSRMHLMLTALLQKDASKRPSALQLLSLPFLRERIPYWMSARRMMEEFGTTDLARGGMLKEWKYDIVGSEMILSGGMTNENYDLMNLTNTTSSSVTSTSNMYMKNETTSRSGVSSRSPFTSQLLQQPFKVSPTSSSRHSHQQCPPSALLNHLSAVATSPRFISEHQPQQRSLTPRGSSQLQSRIGFDSLTHPHIAAASDGLPRTRERARSSAASSTSTPSPLPTLKSRPLILTPIPNPNPMSSPLERKKSEGGDVVGSEIVQQQKAVATATTQTTSDSSANSHSSHLPCTSTLASPSHAPPTTVATTSASSTSSATPRSSAWTLVEKKDAISPNPPILITSNTVNSEKAEEQRKSMKDVRDVNTVSEQQKHSVTSSLTSHPMAAPTSSAPGSSESLLHIPTSVSSFHWSLPPSLLPAIALPAPTPANTTAALSHTLTEQLELVRIYLEKHIPIEVLKNAYELMRNGSAASADETNEDGEIAETDATSMQRHQESSSSPGAAIDASVPRLTSTDSQVLQLLHISQTHLVTLLQQLIQAERAAESEANKKIR